MNIENAKTTFFTDKEHYLAFRKAWAAAVNSPRAKSHLEPHDEEIRDCAGSYSHSRGTGRHKVQGWIERRHVILYNLLRGRSADNGFTNVTNKNRLNNGGLVNHGLYFGLEELRCICKDALALICEPCNSKWAEASMARFLEPFGETVSKEMLKALLNHVPKVPYMSQGYLRRQEIENENETSHRAAA